MSKVLYVSFCLLFGGIKRIIYAGSISYAQVRPDDATPRAPPFRGPLTNDKNSKSSDVEEMACQITCHKAAATSSEALLTSSFIEYMVFKTEALLI
jgi:hypothetical protein